MLTNSKYLITTSVLGGVFLLIAFLTLVFSQLTGPKPASNVQGATTTSAPVTVVYPDKTLTPGEVFPDVTAAQVCVTGYSSSVRDVSVATKKLVYTEYHVSYPQPAGAYEVDHFIPLELGGSNDIKNLFLEPAEPRPGFHEKDMVENYLHDQVCKHGLDLKVAQQEIQTDWYKVYQQIGNPGQ